MAKVERSVDLTASAETVWAVIGDFGDMGWYPGNKGTDTELVDGKLQRIVSLRGGAELREQQENDDREYSYTYSIASGPMPLTGYLCSLGVTPDGDGCTVSWSSRFEPAGMPEDQVAEMIAGVYEAGLKALKERF